MVSPPAFTVDAFGYDVVDGSGFGDEYMPFVYGSMYPPCLKISRTVSLALRRYRSPPSVCAVFLFDQHFGTGQSDEVDTRVNNQQVRLLGITLIIAVKGFFDVIDFPEAQRRIDTYDLQLAAFGQVWVGHKLVLQIFGGWSQCMDGGPRGAVKMDHKR